MGRHKISSVTLTKTKKSQTQRKKIEERQTQREHYRETDKE
jgi:tmRNA-binding protein